MMLALAPGFEPVSLESLAEVEVAVAWTEHADPLVRTRVEEATARFPRRRTIDLPIADDSRAVFMREVADTHRELYAENADLYGANVASKIERCLEVSDSEYQAGLQARESYRAAFDERLGSADLVVTPTLPRVAPPFGDEREQRGWLTLLTWPFNVLGAPALAIPCGPAEDGLPASVQIAGRPGADALVLAAAAELDALLKP